MKTKDLRVNGSGSYHLLWNAKADLGLVRYTNMVVRVTIDNKVLLLRKGLEWLTDAGMRPRRTE